MKTIFPEFYRLSESDFKEVWDGCTFIFDANVLLNLYRYSHNTSDEFIKILTDTKIKDRVWIPHQFAFEYQKDRLVVISEQRRSYKELLEEIGSLVKKFYRHPFLKMKSVMSSDIDEIEKTARNHPRWNQEDPIRDTLTALFENRTGKSFSSSELESLYEEGRMRYAKKIPPGYADGKKEGEGQFGDWVGWKQILNYAKQEKTPIILVTDDDKEDWWWKVKGEVFGARYELSEEIRDVAGVFFCMYNSKLFLKQATKYLKRKLDKKAASEIREITEKKSTGNAVGTASSEEIMISSEDIQRILDQDVGRSDISQNKNQ